MNRHPITIALVSLLCLTACGKRPAPAPPPFYVSAVKPLLRDVPFYVDYIGHVVAKTNVSLQSQVSGNIMAQYFEEGAEVKKGDLLLVIDPRPFEAALAQAEATLAQSYATLHIDKETRARNFPLAQQNFIAQLTYDQYVTNVLVDEAIVAQNKAALETAKINLGYCFMEAPMDCVTGKLQVKTGNFVNAAANTELVLLNQIQPILVDFYVPETDLFTIQQKQRSGDLKIIVYPDPEHKYPFYGELTLIDNQVNTSTGAILLEGTFPNEEKLLWSGHFVDVRLILEEKKGALLLPNQAVMNGQNGHYVFIVKSDATIETRNVVIGQRYDDSYISIQSGITADEVIVTEGQLNLYPGMKVVIKPSKKEPKEVQ
jgi:multidrug efflux system membrane fusion protein